MFSRFQGLAAKKLLQDMDANGDHMISRDEWRHYFKRVLATGEYGEADIMEELESFMQNRVSTT